MAAKKYPNKLRGSLDRPSPKTPRAAKLPKGESPKKLSPLAKKLKDLSGAKPISAATAAGKYRKETAKKPGQRYNADTSGIAFGKARKSLKKGM
jgi:hypothetical protein